MFHPKCFPVTIGLVICKSMVKLHGGEIKAVPKDNGILIEVELPMTKRVNLG